LGTWVVPTLDADFTTDIEDLFIAYIFDKWSLADPLKGSAAVDQNSSISFRPGFFDGSKPYEVCALQTRTVAEKRDSGHYVFQTEIEVMQRARRLQDDLDPTTPLTMLKTMEAEVRRIVMAYRAYEIPGVDGLNYNGYEMYYNPDDTYAKSDWSLSTKVSVFYQKQDSSNVV